MPAQTYRDSSQTEFLDIATANNTNMKMAAKSQTISWLRFDGAGVQDDHSALAIVEELRSYGFNDSTTEEFDEQANTFIRTYKEDCLVKETNLNRPQIEKMFPWLCPCLPPYLGI